MPPPAKFAPTRNRTETGAERRAFGRRKTLLVGKLRVGNVSYDCTLRDLSEGGAQLEFAEPIDASGWLKLSFEGYPDEVLCEPRHASGNTLGVQFARLIVVPVKGLAPA